MAYVIDCSWEALKAEAQEFVNLSSEERLALQVWLLAATLNEFNPFDMSQIGNPDFLEAEIPGYQALSKETLNAMETAILVQMALKAGVLPAAMTPEELGPVIQKMLCGNQNLMPWARVLLLCGIVALGIAEQPT